MESSPATKLALLTVNVIIMVYSVVIIAMSSVALVSFYDFSTLVYDSLIAIPAISVGIGTAAFLLAVLGAFVSTRKSYCLGITFCVLVSVVLLIELTLGISYYVLFLINISANTEEALFTSIGKYRTDERYTTDWDWMQQKYSCCGVREAHNWDSIVNATIRGLPMSCCRPNVGEVGNASCLHSSLNRHLYGCHSQVQPVFVQNAYVSGGMLIALSVLEIVCIIVGSVFTHPLKNAW